MNTLRRSRPLSPAAVTSVTAHTAFLAPRYYRSLAEDVVDYRPDPWLDAYMFECGLSKSRYVTAPTTSVTDVPKLKHEDDGY